MMKALDEEARARELHDAIAMLEPPQLSGDTFARIVARRGNGERISLRTIDAPIGGHARRSRIVAFTFTAVAASIIAALLVRRSAIVSTTDVPGRLALAAVDSACANAPATASDSSMLRHLMISAFGIPAACGAEPAQDAPIAYDASQIESGTFTYSSLSITDGVFTSTHPSSAITISRTTWKGAPAILAVRDGPPPTGVHLDSLIVSAGGPTPLYWASWYTSQHPKGAIHADFDSSMITIAMTGHLDTIARFPFRMKSGQLPFGFALALAVPALPLAEGWHGVIEIAPPIHPRAYDRFLKPWETISLRVVGRETIHVAAGRFDCWKVQIGEPKDDSFLWVSTANHLVIRSVSASRFGDTSFEDSHDLERMILIPQ